ncbi:MAG: putative porin [Sulfurimonas sp.]
MKKVVLSSLTVLAIGSVAANATPNPPLVSKSVSEATGIEHDILKRIHFKGDLRLRYESKETWYKDGDNDLDKETYHNRYRLRLVGAVDLTDKLTFDVGMRSGYANPTSGNQTFSNSAEGAEDGRPLSDYFWQSLRFNILDVAYKDGDHTVKVGRHPYMIYRPIKSQLIWDNDISLNGVSYNYENDARIINLGANQPTYAERVNARDNVNLFFAQYVEKMKLNDNSKLNLGASIYYYDGLKGNTAMYYPEKGGKQMGNTFVTDGSGAEVYENDFHIVEGFGELKFKDVLGKPVALAAGVAYNAAASDNNFGYDLAVQLGKAKNVNDWQVKYSYTDIQEDAVLGDHSDSDNFGGGTAAKGHAIRAKYKFGKNTYLAGTFFYNTLYAGKVNALAADYERVQLDAIIKF